jgi:hypothetical protein
MHDVSACCHERPAGRDAPLSCASHQRANGSGDPDQLVCAQLTRFPPSPRRATMCSAVSRCACTCPSRRYCALPVCSAATRRSRVARLHLRSERKMGGRFASSPHAVRASDACVWSYLRIASRGVRGVQASDVSTTIRTLQALAADPQLFKSKRAFGRLPLGLCPWALCARARARVCVRV